MSASPDDFSDDLVVDDEVLHRLAEVFDALEPVPPHLLELAYSARLMGDLTAELAQLTYDSRVDSAAVLRRGAENQARLLSFSNDHLTVDVSLLADGRTIVGELFPVAAQEVIVESRDGVVSTAAVDEFGRFRLVHEIESFRLRVVGQLLTPWIDRSA